MTTPSTDRELVLTRVIDALDVRAGGASLIVMRSWGKATDQLAELVKSI